MDGGKAAAELPQSKSSGIKPLLHKDSEGEDQRSLCYWGGAGAVQKGVWYTRGARELATDGDDEHCTMRTAR